MHVVLQKQVKAHAHGSLKGIFERHNAQLALAGCHFLKNLSNVAARPELGGMTKIFHARKIRERALGAEVGHILGPLQRARRRKDFAPDGPQVFVGQGPGIAGHKAVEHFLFAQGLKDDARHIGLDASYLKAQGGALVKESQQILIHGVYLVAYDGKACASLIGSSTWGRGFCLILGPVAVAVVHARSPGCLR